MKRHYIFPLFLGLFLIQSITSEAQLAITAVRADSETTVTVEVTNTSDEAVNIDEYWLCDFPQYDTISQFAKECGNSMLMPGESAAIMGFRASRDDSELGIYRNTNWADPSAIVDYVEWGSTGHQRSSVAVAAGVWTAGDFVPAFVVGETLVAEEDGNTASEWSSTAMSVICAMDSCQLNGAEISLRDGGGTEVSICVGDGIFDSIFVNAFSSSAEFGDTSIWVITDENDDIIAIPSSPEIAGFEGAGPGLCNIWYLTYSGEISGVAARSNRADISGDCFAFSNAIAVTRNGIAGGVIALRDGGTSVSICVGDGIFDSIFVNLDSAMGDTTIWVITDDMGNIIGLPPTPEVAPFEGAGGGICYIRNLSVRGEINGVMAQANIADISGDCFAWSNEIEVTRNAISGGVIALRDGGTSTSICVGDGNFDSIFVNLDSAMGDTTIWVITDDMGNIIGLPPTPEVAPFEGAGGGICYIRNLSVRGEINGVMAQANIADITGDCFAWSNEIEVTRNEVSGGWIGLKGSGADEMTICVGDGMPDSIFVDLSGNIGDTSLWVITDTEGNIIGIPPSPEVANFEGADPGICYIQHISALGELSGLTGDGNISDLVADCYAISNRIIINRVSGDECANICNASGGTVWLRDGGKEVKICVGDGEPDNIIVNATANVGDTSLWIITDDEGNIIGLPPSIESVNLDSATAGTCLVWNLSYFGFLEIDPNGNISDIRGTCWDLSDSVVIDRLSGDDCDQISSVVDNLDGVINVRAYPNPVISQLNVELNFNERVNIASLRLYNYLGQAVIVRDISGAQGERLEEIEVSSLPAGAYILGVHTNKGSYMQNIIVAE